MRHLKTLFLLISLLLFIGSKVHSAPVVAKFKKISLGKSDSFKVFHKIIQQKKIAPLKRKRKPRGIKRAVPHIADITLEQTSTYKEFQPVWLEGSFLASFYSANLKRGPPLQ
jgi:hypothetical protein